MNWIKQQIRLLDWLTAPLQLVIWLPICVAFNKVLKNPDVNTGKKAEE